MNAAMDLIWTNSYGSTSVDAICEKAGAKKGSFYHFFKSKSQLAVKAWRRTGNARSRAWTKSFPQRCRPWNVCEATFSMSTKVKPRPTENAVRSLVAPIAPSGARLVPRTARSGNRCEKFLAATNAILNPRSAMRIAEGLISAPNARAKAQMLVAYFRGCLAQARIENDVRPLRSMASGALELLGAKSRRGAKK
jgi:TetR/AcrR family transcriptional repressor of nem operon